MVIPRATPTPETLSRVLSNYDNPEFDPVALRFAVVDFAEEPMDVHAVSYSDANTQPEMSILEAGAADGAFLEYARLIQGHLGELVGIELKPLQMRPRNTAITDATLHETLEQFGIQIPQQTQEQQPLFKLLQGDVTDLSRFDAASFDRVFALFMLYHVAEEKLSSTLEGFARVAKPDGVITIATSGEEHKKVHRDLKAEIANELHIEPPPRMNKGFTTEVAKLILPKHFKTVYVHEQITDMVIDDDYTTAAYLGSQLSLTDQYSGDFDRETFEGVLADVVYKKIKKDIETNGAFRDCIRRSIFFASNDESFMPNDE